MPRVSVCTTVLNQSDLLKGMIESVMAQSFEDWELIVVDDGSTENIAAVVHAFEDQRIRLHRLTENKGVVKGINYAMSLARGDYFQPLAADERISPDKLACQVTYLDETPEIHAIWGLPKNGPTGERPEWEQYRDLAHNRSNEAWVRTLVNLESIPIGGASMLCRRGVLERIGYFDEQFIRCSDLEWFVRFFQHCQGRVMPYRWVTCAENPGSLSNTASPAEFWAEVTAVRAKHPVSPPPVGGTVTVAIPVKNMERWIADAIDCALGQTYAAVQVMVWDDGSTDGTLDRVRAIGNTRVEVFHSDESLGTEGALNQMLARCATPFFMVLCADDQVSPDMVDKAMARFTANPWLEFVATTTDFIDENGAPFTAEHPFKQIMKACQRTREQWLQVLYYGNNYFGTGIYRTQAAKDIGGWDTTVGCIADYEMYLKLLQRGPIDVIQEDLTHTRIHGENRSLLSPEAAARLKGDYHRIKARYYAPRMKVVIATPFYEMRGFSPYIFSMCHTIKMLTQLGVEHEFWELSGDSYVDRAKNTIMNKFLEDPAATDLFIIDSDMHWNADAMLKMLALPEEVVVGSYPQKNGWDKWTSMPFCDEDKDNPGKFHPVGRLLEDGTALLLSEYLAGGFMRIKRSALERFKEHYPQFVYYDPSADPSSPSRLYTEFSTCELGRDAQDRPIRWGEDRVFGRRLKDMGIQCHIYPNIDFGHYGIKGWTGNFDHWLRGKRAAADAIGKEAT